MSKLARSFRHVLARLEQTPNRFVAVHNLPNGNGHCVNDSYASGVTMRDLRRIGFVEWGQNDDGYAFGYRITPAGRAALASEEGR